MFVRPRRVTWPQIDVADGSLGDPGVRARRSEGACADQLRQLAPEIVARELNAFGLGRHVGGCLLSLRVADEHQPRAERVRRDRRRLDQRVGHGQGDERAARRVAFLDASKHRRHLRRRPAGRGVEMHGGNRNQRLGSALRFLVRDGGHIAELLGRDDQILDRATDTEEELAAIRVGDQQLPARVGEDANAIIGQLEAPRLGVVARRRQRRVAQEATSFGFGDHGVLLTQSSNATSGPSARPGEAPRAAGAARSFLRPFALSAHDSRASSECIPAARSPSIGFSLALPTWQGGFT